jgi:hypothetical protein
MNYCAANATWISPANYGRLYDELGNRASRRLRLHKVAPEQRQRAAESVTADYLLVSGSIDRGATAGQLDPVLQFPSSEPGSTANPGGPYCLRFTAPESVPDFCFDVPFADESGRKLNTSYFVLQVPAIPGISRLAMIDRSSGSERELHGLSAGSGPPSVSINSPVSGAKWSGDTTISWTGSDPGGLPLTYLLHFSRDGGQSWYPMSVLPLTDPEFAIDTNQLVGGSDVYFRVTALNGLHTSSTTVGPIDIPQEPRLVLANTTIDFGEIGRGERHSRELVLSNTGTGPFVIKSLSVDNEAFQVSPTLPAYVWPGGGGERGIPIVLVPRATGQLEATLTINGETTVRLVAKVSDQPTVAGGTGGTGSGGTGGGTQELVKITPLLARGWPNERNFNNPPPNAVDGKTDTFTWTTNPNNTVLPSYFGVDFGSSRSVSRIRLFKDNDGGGGTLSDHFKNLVIEYTTSPASTPLPERAFTRVTGLANGYNGTEFLTAISVNSDGTVTRDSHNSLNSGWASLSFAAVNATGIRIAFSSVTNPAFFNHYKVHEFEAYGPPGSGSGGGGAAAPGPNLLQNGSADVTPVTGCTVPASISGWTTDGRAGLCSYNAGNGYPGPADPGPPNRGANFFWGGGSAASSLSQVVSLTSNAAQIDAGTQPFTFSGYLGGYAGDGDNVKATLTFLNQSGATVGTALVLGPVTPADRGGRTGMFLRSNTGNVPAGARSARVTLDFARTAGDSNDGYADDIVFSLGGGSVTGGGTPSLQFSLNGIDAGGNINFLSVNVGATATVPLTVRNTGTAAAVVTSIVSSNSIFSAAPQSFSPSASHPPRPARSKAYSL